MIYIKADGSIEPSDANITATDNVCYTFTGDISERRLVIERDNIVLNGNGMLLRGRDVMGDRIVVALLSSRENPCCGNKPHN